MKLRQTKRQKIKKEREFELIQSLDDTRAREHLIPYCQAMCTKDWLQEKRVKIYEDNMLGILLKLSQITITY